MSVFVNQSKNQSVFMDILRYGKETLIRDLENTTFNDVVFTDGTMLKDLTFNQLTEQIWANLNKNQSTFSNVAKS